MSVFNKRDGNEKEIVAALLAAGCSVHQVKREPFDLVVGKGFMTYLLETKGDKGRMTESQKQFCKYWVGHYEVVRSAEEALKAVGL